MIIVDLNKEDFLKIQETLSSTINDIENNNPSFSFLQSWHWAMIQKNFGYSVHLKGIKEGGEVVGFFVAIEKKIFFNKKYWYLPRGPFFLKTNFVKENLIDLFKKIIKKEKLFFIRLEPVLNNSEFSEFFKKNKKNIKKTKNIQPDKTSFLDLNYGQEELLKKMAQKTRYNIKLASKKGLKIQEVGLDGFSSFYGLMETTSRRDKFFIHSEDYYYNLIKYNNDFIKLFEVRFKDKVLASGVFCFHLDTAYYLHGASSNEMRNFMAPYFLQWELIKLAQNQGFRYYDFYGVDDKKWPGVSRFKKGFAGQEYLFLGTFDIVFNNFLYNIYLILRKFKRIIKFL